MMNIIRNYVVKRSGKIFKKPNYRITMDQIGLMESVFLTKNGTPRQSYKLVSDSSGKIKIDCKHADDALRGLEGYSHVWVLFWFHKNNEDYKKKIKTIDDKEYNFDYFSSSDKNNNKNSNNNNSNNNDDENIDTENNENIIEIKSTIKERSPPRHVTVKPPRLGKRIGVFSTRSPHRYNDIGLSLCKIEKIEYDTIYLSGVDIINGTPIIDIKPYIPQYDSIPDAIVPNWVQQQETAINDIKFTDNANKGIDICLNSVGFGLLDQGDEINNNNNNLQENQIEKIKRLISNVLISEVRSSFRKLKKPDERWGFFIGNLNIQVYMSSPGVMTVYNVEDKNVWIDFQRTQLSLSEIPHGPKIYEINDNNENNGNIGNEIDNKKEL
ncbi:hypothetical protein ACTFIW_002028 [Dictyostelium discoideum]